MSAYARAESLEQAVDLAAQPGARVLSGGTDVLGQLDRGLIDAGLLVDVTGLGLDRIWADGGGAVIGAAATLTDICRSPLLTPYAAVPRAASLAASPLLRNVGTLGGNLCQQTRCWYLRGEEWHCWLGGGDTCYAQLGDHRKHNLQPGDCISAHPSDLAPPLAACRAVLVVASAGGTREVEVLDLYRRPTDENRSLITLEPGEIITEVHLPTPPLGSSYERLGERQAFSFPLVSVAAARHGDEVSVVAGGVANIPVRIDPDEPLRDLPGNPQTTWKRTALATMVARAVAGVHARPLTDDPTPPEEQSP